MDTHIGIGDLVTVPVAMITMIMTKELKGEKVCFD